MVLISASPAASCSCATQPQESSDKPPPPITRGCSRSRGFEKLSSPRKRGPSTPHHLDRPRRTGSRLSLRSAGMTAEPLRLLRLRRLFLGLDQLAVDQRLGDLDGVERGALAQIVGHHPQRQAVVDGGVLADAADVGGVLADRLVGRYVTAVLALVDH